MYCAVLPFPVPQRLLRCCRPVRWVAQRSRRRSAAATTSTAAAAPRLRSRDRPRHPMDVQASGQHRAGGGSERYERGNRVGGSVGKEQDRGGATTAVVDAVSNGERVHAHATTVRQLLIRQQRKALAGIHRGRRRRVRRFLTCRSRPRVTLIVVVSFWAINNYRRIRLHLYGVCADIRPVCRLLV